MIESSCNERCVNALRVLELISSEGGSGEFVMKAIKFYSAFSS